MATIGATWKRTVRVKEYESETLELHVEKDIEVVAAPGVNLVEAAAELDRELALAGDALVAERLEARVAPVGGKQPVLPRSTGNVAETPRVSGPTDPDPFV